MPLSCDLRQMSGTPEVMGAMYVWVQCCRSGWDFPQFDSTAVDCSAIELDDLTFRRPGFRPEEVPAGGDTCGVAMLNELIFCRTSFLPDDLSARRDGDYIWRDLWTGLSVCNRPVTGSPTFGSSYILEQCCLWLAALPLRWIGSAEVPLCHHLVQLVSRTSHDVEAPFHSPLCRHSLGNVFAEWSKYDLVIFLDSPLCRHPVWSDGGSVFAELDMCLYDPCLCVCRQLLAFNPRHTSD